jgi:replicative DNA helicase
MARIDLKKIRAGFMNKAEMNSLVQATTKISKSRLFIDDTPSLDVMEFQASARRLDNENHLDLIVVDYLQLMRSPSRRGQENRQVEVAEISGGIKALAKELKIPIIVLAQLNRNPDARTGSAKGKPKLSDLRESGAIEQDADLVGLLWREAYYLDDEDEQKEAEGKAEFSIEKHRNGETGKILLTFLGSITRFEDRAPEGRTPPG